MSLKNKRRLTFRVNVGMIWLCRRTSPEVALNNSAHSLGYIMLNIFGVRTKLRLENAPPGAVRVDERTRGARIFYLISGVSVSGIADACRQVLARVAAKSITPHVCILPHTCVCVSVYENSNAYMHGTELFILSQISRKLVKSIK